MVVKVEVHVILCQIEMTLQMGVVICGSYVLHRASVGDLKQGNM